MRRLTPLLLLLLFSSLGSGSGVLTAMLGPYSGIVTVTNRTVGCTDFGAGAGHCEAGMRWNADGTTDEKDDSQGGGVTYTQVNNTTDWVIPNSTATITTFYIRATEFSYNENETSAVIFSTKNGTMGTWLSVGIGTSREWSLDANSNTAGEGTITWVIDFDIASDPGGTDILDTGRITLAGEL